MPDSIVNINDLEVDQTIAFKSISQYDTVQWKGKIVAMGNYEFARGYEDILPYYNNIKKTNQTVPPLEQSHFIILKLYENETKKTLLVFAKEWIEPTSLQLIDVEAYVDLRVFVSEKEINEVLNLLRSNDIPAVIQK